MRFEGDKLESSDVFGPSRQQMLDAFRFKDGPDKDIKQVWICFDGLTAARMALSQEGESYYFETRYLSSLSSSTAERLSVSALPLGSQGRFRGERDKEYDDYGSNYYWRLDDDNLLKRYDGNRLQRVAYPITPGESGFPTVQVIRVSEDDLCKQDLRCWGDKHSVAASVSCTRAVENILEGEIVYE